MTNITQTSPAPIGHNGPPGHVEPTTTIRLVAPIATEQGEITHLTLRDPTLGELVQSDDHPGMLGSVQIIAAAANIKPDTARRLKTRDTIAASRWFDSLVPPAPPPALDDDGEPKAVDIEGGERTFDLLGPVEIGGKVVTQITLREPDVEVGIAIEKVKGAHRQTARMIAVLSGRTVPEVLKLRRRDVMVIERWLIPFVTDTPSKGAGGAT
ncbi:MAG: Phage tail assembly chaperone protein or 41 or 14 [Pseudomonadota bacterium]|jgi:hypothetical protein